MKISRANSKTASFRALILDMDGVLWRANEPIGNLPEVFEIIKALGLRVALATNNSTLSVEQYQDKFFQFGVSLDPAQIITSSHAASSHLHQRFPSGGPVYIVGENGLRQALIDQGFYEAEENVLAVVAGLDRNFTYQKLLYASRLIRAGALFIATNADHNLPTPEGLAPGAGSILAAIQIASGVEPFIMGKPGSEMYRVALQYMNVLPHETLVVGDRLDTDITGAQALGCPTALVLSGVSTRSMAEQWQPPVDYVVQDLTALLECLKADLKEDHG